MKLAWTKTKDGWLGICGRFRAEIQRPYPGGLIYHWHLIAQQDPDLVGAGGAGSIVEAKKAAEHEAGRLAKR